MKNATIEKIKLYGLWYLVAGLGYLVGQFIPWQGSIFSASIRAMLLTIFIWPMRIFVHFVQSDTLTDFIPEYLGLFLAIGIYYWFRIKKH